MKIKILIISVLLLIALTGCERFSSGTIRKRVFDNCELYYEISHGLALYDGLENIKNISVDSLRIDSISKTIYIKNSNGNFECNCATSIIRKMNDTSISGMRYFFEVLNEMDR